MMNRTTIMNCWLPAGLVAMGLVACTGGPPSDERAAGAGETLDALVETYWDDFLELNPVFATFIGDHRFDDQLTNDLSEEWIEESRDLERRSLVALDAIDLQLLDGQDRLTYEIFKRGRETLLESFQYPQELLPINQFFSMPTLFAQLGSGAVAQPFATVEDYESFLSRVDGFVVWMDTAIERMREGAAQGIVQPRIVMEKSLPQLSAHLTNDVTQSVFYQPIVNIPEDFPSEEKLRLADEYEKAISERLIPAYQRVHDFVRDEYLPSTRDSVGLSAIPGGEPWYAFEVRASTTTDLTPDQIHRMGLDEVARIRGEIESVMEEIGFQGDIPELFEFLRSDDQFYFTEPEQLLEAYRALKTRVATKSRELFSLLPEADFEIRPVEAFRAASAASAHYMPPSPDGSHPGIFYVNTYDLRSRPNYSTEEIFLHEAIPGHHFQIALAAELENLPRFRRFGGLMFTAYVEGWGLYAESLGSELGLYTDPYQKLGALSGEILRAVRLVVDTGMHAKGWTREEALEYLVANTPTGETDAVAEVERYIAIPGQALAYKIGQLKIRELRHRAEEAFGEDFDIKAFHARVLEDGAVPLDVLEAKTERWIAESR